jgi:sortase A
MVTLVTCTPYGINTHRLLVKGKRIDVDEVNLLIYSEARKVNKAYVAIAVGLVLWTVTMIVLLYVSSKHRTKKLSREEYLRRHEILEKYRR